jgi:hypothetical protein
VAGVSAAYNGIAAPSASPRLNAIASRVFMSFLLDRFD